MTLAEELNLRVVLHRATGRWMVSSLQLARATSHRPTNITRAALVAEQELGLSDALVWAVHEKNGRRYRFCWIPGYVLAHMRLHNVPPRCVIVPEVLAEYQRLIVERAGPPPEPAPEPKPPPPWQVSWQITNAVELLIKAGAPEDPMLAVKKWNNDRQWFELQKRAKTWSQVHAIYADATPKEQRP
jgi:hypothetical protein